MASDDRAVSETVLTVTSDKGEAFTIVAFKGGGYGLTRAGQLLDRYCETIRHCLDALVRIAGIDFDER
ncbi:MAG TPA: hypothetical protein VEA69_19370 [Tepidisphaeraceae bacterium]|nr:hypothetical protein [Tepidisphaeraceae bacterium]